MTSLPADLTPDRIVELLGLVPLVPEGGHVGETHRSPEASAIHYLMAGDSVSGLHRLEHLEIWAWHAGSPARLLLISPDGEVAEPVLGMDLAAGERPQVAVPGGWWQACEPLGPWTLLTTVVAPPYTDGIVTFEGGAALAQRHPAHADRIRRLARG